ncbi:hypothetical protein [Pendulispora albinea]|uniref:Uncharacterized protein n=1 Tax=Pendulispora albinea TaxID=2741071 RepID=A0ABZ2LXT2_9BACT
MRAATLGGCIAVAAVFAGPSAFAADGPDAAEHETARLVYQAPDAPVCPDESSFRNLVAARLGYDPFRPDGRHAVTVKLQKERGRIRARAEVRRAGPAQGSGREPGGAPQAAGARELAGEACEPLAAALATTVAMALDPVRGASGETSLPPLPNPKAETPPAGPTVVFIEQAPGSQPPQENPAPRESAPPRESSSARAAPPPREAHAAPGERVAFVASVGPVASFALAPAPTFGGAMDIGFRYGAFSLSAEGRVEWTPSTATVDSGDRVEATVYSGALLPCVHFGGWLGCAVGRIGAFQGRAPDVVRPSLGTSTFGAVGLRGGYALSITKIVAIRAAIEGALPLVRTTLKIDGTGVWTAPPGTAGVDLALVVTLR